MDSTSASCQPSSSNVHLDTENNTQENVVGILEKQRTEILHELTRLRQSDRPVTSSGNKEAVESFFQQTDSNSLNCTETSTHRPEAIIVEVQGLVERRPVSSLLQSLNFRRTLENALVGSINTTLSRISNQRTASNSTLNSVSSNEIPSVPTVTSESTSVVHGPTNNVVTQSSFNNTATFPTVNTPRPAVIISNSPALSSTRRAEQWLMQQVNDVIENSDLPNNEIWSLTEENHRQEIIGEISELVQQQLVTSSLNSTLRDSLEYHVATRVASTGADGQRVQNYIRNNIHPTSGHIRNDFSHLGIFNVAPELSDNLDEISVISATAAVQVSQNHASLAMTKEIQLMKMQFNELKSMMKLNFEMQLDIQRSIRQEVAHALAASNGANNSADHGSTSKGTKPVQDGPCLICLDHMTDTIIYQCGHLCICYMCALELKRREAHCPICRAPIKDIMRAYRNN